MRNGLLRVCEGMMLEVACENDSPLNRVPLILTPATSTCLRKCPNYFNCLIIALFLQFLRHPNLNRTQTAMMNKEQLHITVDLRNASIAPLFTTK